MILPFNTSWSVVENEYKLKFNASVEPETSRSTRLTLCQNSCIATPKLITVVVLPTPPLQDTIPIILFIILNFEFEN